MSRHRRVTATTHILLTSDSRKAAAWLRWTKLAARRCWRWSADHSLGPGWHLPPAPAAQTICEPSPEHLGFESYPSNLPTNQHLIHNEK